jgi:ribosomal protein S18 acetylase RimI-like enzyme
VAHPENEIALGLYMSLGFEIESRQENFFGDGEPRLVLARKD